MKLTTEQLTIRLMFQADKTMKGLVWYYSNTCSERTIRRVLKKAIAEGKVRTNKSHWPYHYEAI